MRPGVMHAIYSISLQEKGSRLTVASPQPPRMAMLMLAAHTTAAGLATGATVVTFSMVAVFVSANKTTSGLGAPPIANNHHIIMITKYWNNEHVQRRIYITFTVLYM